MNTFNMTTLRDVFLVAFLLVVFPKFSVAQFIDTKWKVIGYVGETWFANPENIIGKYQAFYKGFANGVFYSCDYAGQSMTYNTYSLQDFLRNKEFKLFKENNVLLKDTTIFVHRITCNGKKDSDRKVMYPFVTVDKSTKAYYLFEGAIFLLQY